MADFPASDVWWSLLARYTRYTRYTPHQRIRQFGAFRKIWRTHKIGVPMGGLLIGVSLFSLKNPHSKLVICLVKISFGPIRFSLKIGQFYVILKCIYIYVPNIYPLLLRKLLTTVIRCYTCHHKSPIMVNDILKFQKQHTEPLQSRYPLVL